MSSASASAPASSANLGPAFDTLAIALDLRCHVSAEASEEWSVEHRGDHKPASAADDGVLMAARRAAGDDNPMRLVVSNEIPLGKGLGSSAAAFVAGSAAALRLLHGEATPDHVFRVANDLEGHPDNVAASVYGGLILVPAEGMPVRLPIHPSIHVVVGVPRSELSTSAARTAVARSFDRDVLVRSLGRVSALVAGLLTADPELFAAAHGDEIHEGPRAGMSPEVDTLIAVARRSGALHAARSGAGPSVVALATSESVDGIVLAFKELDAEPLNLSVSANGLA